ncbi:hypothetical protein CGLO_03688 [Colletotrichum gloeosporioides Cg-14]|uniref:Major facilitator superfamily (MFS) profile domain-containing protein n=1 Tax=Colletotrichum gloeosporioides (strain Cg-14) TaxID=1237896 RepID=T0M622_COLGC|nr:hypothetical protein CGLO_03688 [Colletotrichum gloeosporioides Cg-14]
MFFFPSLVLIFFPWFPESPYFLLKHKNDKDGALNALLRLYGPSNRQLAEMQVAKMESALQSTEALNHSENRFNYIQLFKGKNLQRTIVAFTAPASQVLSGIIFVVGYLPYFLTLVGFDEVFNWNMYLFTISLSANLFSFWTVERVGRRKVTIYGLFILMVVMFIIGGLNVQPSQPKYMATIGLIYVWAAVFQLSIGPLGYTLASEVATASLRAETQAVVTVSNALFGWTFSFSVPYMINPDAGNLGGKVGFLFGGLGLFCTLLGFFLFPETKGMTFAEIDWAYLNDIKPWRFSEAIAEQRLAERAGNGFSKRTSRDGAVHVEDGRKL